MISFSGYYNETRICRHCAFCVKQACIWICCLLANLYYERKSSPLDFRFYYCHNLLALYLLQMGILSLKLRAPAIASFENEILAFYNALSHWSSYFPFWKWKENKSRKIKCSAAVMGPVLGTNLNKLFLLSFE